MPVLQAYFRKHKKRLDLQRLVQEHRDMLEQARDAEVLAEQQVRAVLKQCTARHRSTFWNRVLLRT